MKILGLIPARGGSEGIPRKNIKKLCDRPLIDYTISASLKSKYLNDVIVSTDDQEIASISKRLGATVPFMRPKVLGSNNSPTIDTVIHALEQMAKKKYRYKYVCLLQPTNPLIKTEIINKSIEKIIKSNNDSLISVREIPNKYNPYWAFKKNNKKSLELVLGDKIISRRQDLPVTYYRDGMIYITKTKTILDTGSLYGQKIGSIDLSKYEHVNIDTFDDWDKAKRIILGKK